jgi:hypothetical protein
MLGGPVWVSDPARTDLKSPVRIEDGDIWYYRPDCTNPNLTVDSNLSFTPAYRGLICVPSPWTVVYTAPTPGAFAAAGDVANTNPAPTVDAYGCTVFKPGRYTVAPSFGTNTYMKSGNYYFHNVTLDVTNAVVRTISFENAGVRTPRRQHWRPENHTRDNRSPPQPTPRGRRGR